MFLVLVFIVVGSDAVVSCVFASALDIAFSMSLPVSLCGVEALCHFSDIVGYLFGDIFNSSTIMRNSCKIVLDWLSHKSVLFSLLL